MAGKNDDVNDDNIFDEGEMEDDGTAAIIRQAWEESMKDEDEDDGGFDQPLDASSENEPDVVSPDKGRDLLDDAEIAKEKGRNDDKTADPNDSATEPNAKNEGEAEESEGKESADDKAADDLKSAALDSLLDGVPDDRKGEITRRLSDAEAAMKPFESPYIKQQMQAFGASPKEVAGRLVELATFANTNPDEYVAWIARETGGDKPEDILQKAAARFGFKLTKDGGGEDEDDVFLDPEVKALKEENARLKAKMAGDSPNFGPDTPERAQARTAAQQLQDFITETDETGQAKRPLFEPLRARISELAFAHRSSTNQAVTTDDLQRFYDQAAEEARRAFGSSGAATPAQKQDSAAQTAPSVSEQLKTKADAAQRARRASKSVDGTGQGASRRPALSDNASLDDVIRHFASQG